LRPHNYLAGPAIETTGAPLSNCTLPDDSLSKKIYTVRLKRGIGLKTPNGIQTIK